MIDGLLLENQCLIKSVTLLDVERIAEAATGWSLEDVEFIKRLTTRSKSFLANVSMLYRDKGGTSLEKVIDTKIGTSKSNWYAYLARLLVLPEDQVDSRVLTTAMKGKKVADKPALVEFLCCRHPRRVRQAKKKWEGLHDASFVDKLSDELSGDFRTIALRLLQGKRDTNRDDYEEDDDAADEAKAKEMAKQIHSWLAQGEGGKREIISMLCLNASGLNGAVRRQYEDLYDVSLERALDGQFDDPAAREALRALLQGPYHVYAQKLKVALSEDKYQVVCRILGSHDKWEVRKIAKAYESKYNLPLATVLKDNCSGDFRALAYAWVKNDDHLEQPRKRVALPDEDDDEEAAPEPRASEAAAAYPTMAAPAPPVAQAQPMALPVAQPMYQPPPIAQMAQPMMAPPVAQSPYGMPAQPMYQQPMMAPPMMVQPMMQPMMAPAPMMMAPAPMMMMGQPMCTTNVQTTTIVIR